MENKSFVKDVINGKSCILDLLAVLQDGTKVNIEVQLGNQNYFDRRSLFYWCKVYTDSLGEGENYRKLPNVIAVNIVDFDFPHRGNVHTCFRLREDTDPTLVLTTALEIHYINMVKWRKQKKDIENDLLQQWLAYFDKSSPPELVEEVAAMNSAIRAASDRQMYVEQDEEARQIYWMRRKVEHDMVSRLEDAHDEGEEKGFVKGKAEGMEKGQTEKALEIARKMKGIGLPITQIADVTGLSPEDIEQFS